MRSYIEANLKINAESEIRFTQNEWGYILVLLGDDEETGNRTWDAWKVFSK